MTRGFGSCFLRIQLLQSYKDTRGSTNRLLEVLLETRFLQHCTLFGQMPPLILLDALSAENLFEIAYLQLVL